MRIPSSDFLIRSYTSKTGDQLLIFNEQNQDGGEPALTVCISCPHRDEEKMTNVYVSIPVDVLDEYLDDLADERDGEDVEEDYELIEMPEEEEEDDE